MYSDHLTDLYFILRNRILSVIVLLSLLTISFSTLSAEEKIYIFHFKVKGSTDKDLEKKVRNGLLLSILKIYPGKYKIMDDDSIQDLSKKLEKLQLAGCSEEICIQEISQAIDARDLISGIVTQTGSRILFDLKKVRKDELTYAQTTESTVNEEFEVSQMDYFLNESAKKLIEKNYTINRKNAPPALTDLGDLGIESAKEKPINDLYLPSTNPRNRILWELLNEPMESALLLRKENKEKESAEAITVILDSIEETLSKEVTNIAPLREVLYSKILGSYSRYFAKKIKEIDESYSQNNLSEEKSLLSYENLYSQFNSIPLKYRPSEKQVPFVLRISRIYETRGDNEFRNTRFFPAKENYKKAFSFLQDKSIDDKSKLNSALESLDKKLKENDLTAKRFVENKVKTNCDTAKAEFVFARMNGRSIPQESQKARERGISLLQESEEILKREKEYSSPDLDKILESTRKEMN